VSQEDEKETRSKYKPTGIKRLFTNGPITLLDWYIIRKFLGTFFFIMVLLMCIACIFDVSEKIDDFIKNSAPIGAILLDYYANFVIHYGNLFSFLIIFIAVIFFTSKMAQNTEIVAILSSGVSFNRLLRPYLIAATILAGMALYLNHFVLPNANADRLAFEEQYIRNSFAMKSRNLHREIEPGTIVSFQHFNYRTNIGTSFSLEKWENAELKYKLISPVVNFDTLSGSWKLNNYVIRTFAESREYVISAGSLDTIFPWVPSDFARRLSVASAMDYHALNKYIQEETDKGSDQVAFYLIEKHQRSSFPFATYILTIIGVSVASRKTRGGIGLHLAIGFLVVMVYIFAMKMTTVAATNAGLDPAIAVWIPNIIFSVIALLFYQRAQK
jgi:lipopolysaccharide export system permease protein